MATLADVRGQVRRRLNDQSQTFWSDAEITTHLLHAYKACAGATRCIWDLAYVENLPNTFTYTWAWEESYADFKAGPANYTAAFERPHLTEGQRVGPASNTSPFEATDGHDDGPIQALAELPDSLSEIDRPTSDSRWIPVFQPNQAARYDHRYELTEGQVELLVTTGQGLRTIRKVRVPSEKATTYTIDGAWGVLRQTDDISSGAASGIEAIYERRFGMTQTWESAFTIGASCASATYTASWESGLVSPERGPSNFNFSYEYARGVAAGFTMTTVTNRFGCPRRIPDHHPMGPESFGIPRRPYQDAKNVRIEHWREGRTVAGPLDVFELPAGADAYLRDYAMAKCYGRNGPAQDLKLATHYESRYQRGLERVKRRVQSQQRQRVGVLGRARTARHGPPRPHLPWTFGVVVR